MSRFMRVTKVAMTCSIALGVGFLMQYGDDRSADKASARDRDDQGGVQSVMLSSNAQGNAVFGVPNVVTTPLPHVENVQTVAAVDATYLEIDTPAMGTILAAPLGECSTDLVAALRLAAMVELVVSSPCHAGTEFVITHSGMAFSGTTNAAGNAVIKVPALAADARFSVKFNNVEEATVAVVAPDVNHYDRAVLQWRGKDNLQLHALEFGATFGDPGHIWSASTHSAALAHAGDHGFMMRLGKTDSEIPYLAEIYTFPSGLVSHDGQIALQIGVAVTEENCGHELDARAIQTNSGRMLITRELKIPMPGCDAIGESLMLRNMFKDVTLAAN